MDLYILNIFISIHVFPITLWVVVLFVFTIFSVLFSAFITGSEVAYFSLNMDHLKRLRESKKKSAVKALRLLDNPRKLLATILLLENLTNILVILLIISLFRSLFDFQDTPILGYLIIVVVCVLVILLFAEIIPKVYASQNALRVSHQGAAIICFLQNMLSPIVNTMARSQGFMKSHLFKSSFSQLSVEDITQALEYNNATNGQKEKDDREILEGIINFGTIRVSDIMTSRVDIVDIDTKLDFHTLLDIIKSSGFSRLPVYATTRDNIKGVLFSKDLLPYLDKPQSFKWQNLVRPPYYVHEAKKIDDLLSEFQENRVHVAIVVDEYGGTSGMVTLEDILEEIVGDIKDEYDETEILYEKIDNHTFIFEAKILLNDFYKIAEIDSAVFAKITEDVDTLAGLILELKGDIPPTGDQIMYADYVFEIIKSDKRRIGQIKLHIKNKSNQQSDEE